MKKLHGIDVLFKPCQRVLTDRRIADVLLKDLAHCRFYIYGDYKGEHIILAELVLQEESLQYEPFDKRIDLSMAGVIKRTDSVPLTYRLQGEVFGVSGRCSVIPKVCGVDFYMGQSYSGNVGERIQMKFKIKLADIKKQLKALRE
ncbi:hypothetical protein [methane-oxidizing endosymbiont of Gigantopelta aegis]|uniref:hypothetical protein n=1 Tax=methane-oxidizing endosymbiont of Gigantopelta aegis TaxID=2794938 RepID=UPI0018DB9700|nr:hypothetical protein [methane-oxidizing endosymbiont of Gigantopelta aegis]